MACILSFVLNRGKKIEVVLLNRVSILEFFVLNRVGVQTLSGSPIPKYWSSTLMETAPIMEVGHLIT